MEFYNGIQFINKGNIPGSDQMYKGRFRGYYGIQYNHSGVIQCKVEGETWQSGAGPHALITYPGEGFSYGAADGPRHHVFLCFTGPRVEHYLDQGLLHCRRHPLIRVRNGQAFFDTMLEVHQLMDDFPRNYDRAVNLLERLLLCLEEDASVTDAATDKTADEFKALAANIRKHPGRAWDFEKQAMKMSFSYIHFRRLFKQYLQLSAKQYLIHCRVQAAAQLLRNSALPLPTVASTTGFYDIHHMAKVFKQHFSIPPATYRRDFGEQEFLTTTLKR